jgi:hypothetical protein
MGLIVSNGSRENIERSITRNILGALVYPPENTLLHAMVLHPFLNNAAIIGRSGGNPTCWGFQAGGRLQTYWQGLFTAVNNNLHHGEHMLLFEKRNVPNPRVFSGKIIHIEANVDFGNCLWQNPAEWNKWHHIYFLVDIRLQTNNKSFFCNHLGLNDGQFIQQRIANIPPAIAHLI